MKARVAVSCLVVAIACSNRLVAPTTEPSPRAAALERRADTLLTRFLDEPGSYQEVGDNAYVFLHDRDLADDIVALGIHAVPALIACMGDDRATKVALIVRHYGDAPYASAGLICQELFRETTFFALRDTALVRQAAKDAGVGDGVGADGRVFYWESSPAALRRAQRVWQSYWQSYRKLRLTSEPALASSAVGCYAMRLHRTKSDLGVIDTTQEWHFELDTLPLPGTVRPDRIELAPRYVIGPRHARWSTLGERAILVSWRDSAASFGFGFGGTDSLLHGFQLVRFGPVERETFGAATVTRERCAKT